MAKLSMSSKARGGVAGKLRRVVASGPAGDVHQVVTAVSAAVTAGTPSVSLLSGIAEGDDYNQRSGRKAKLLSVRVRGTLLPAAATGSVRIILVLDKSPNGSTPAAADILRTGTNVADPINADNSDRFVILGDDLISSKNYNAAAAGMREYDRYVSLKGVLASFQNTGATASGPTSNALYLYINCDGTATTVTPNIQSDLKFIE